MSFTGERIDESEGILKQISSCSSHLVLKKRNLGIHEFQAGGKTDESSDTGQNIFYLGIHDGCSYENCVIHLYEMRISAKREACGSHLDIV